jgi:hypothetical protein
MAPSTSSGRRRSRIRNRSRSVKAPGDEGDAWPALEFAANKLGSEVVSIDGMDASLTVRCYRLAERRREAP